MLALLVAMNAVGPRPRPDSQTARYRIVSQTVTDMDLTSVGQSLMTVTESVSAFVSIAVSDSAGGHLAHIVVDSSTFDAGQYSSMMPAELQQDAKGTVFHLYVVNGKAVNSVVPQPMNLQAMQLVGAIELLVRGLGTAHAGDAWVDTVRTDTTVAASAATGSRIYKWSVKPAAGSALEYDADWTGSAKVAAATTQMDIQLAGSSQLTAAPGALASAASSNGTGQASMNVAGNTIPLNLKTIITVTAVP